jgi:Acyl dehydratase
MTGLLWQSRTPDEREDVIAFYGVDELRFTAPTYVGDTIHVEIEVVEKVEREHPRASGTVRYDAVVRNQEDETVLRCELLVARALNALFRPAEILSVWCFRW